MATILHRSDVLAPTEQAVDAARRLEAKLDAFPDGEVEMTVSVAGEPHILFEHAVEFFRTVIHEIAQGHRIAIVDLDEELSTTEAAEFLGVSRPTLVGLLKDGRIAHRMVGTHRRVPRGALVEYRKRHRARSGGALQERLQAADDLLASWHAAESPASS
jgi:excisionase family DNA binding protein